VGRVGREGAEVGGEEGIWRHGRGGWSADGKHRAAHNALSYGPRIILARKR
jgi:hypothetical protein